MTGTTTDAGDGMNVSYLDGLTNAATAFRTWAEFRRAMAGGYVPTLHPTTRRKRLLIRAVRAAGFRVWPG